MKIVIFIVLGLVLLVGGGLGGLFATDNMHLVGLGDDPGATAGKDEPAPAPSDALYVQVNHLTIPVIKGNRIAYQILLDLNLEVDGLAAKNDVVAILPRLQDAILLDLIDRPVVDKTGFENIDIKGIKRRLLKTVRRVMGDDTVKNVLIVRAARTG